MICSSETSVGFPRTAQELFKWRDDPHCSVWAWLGILDLMATYYQPNNLLRSFHRHVINYRYCVCIGSSNKQPGWRDWYRNARWTNVQTHLHVMQDKVVTGPEHITGMYGKSEHKAPRILEVFLSWNWVINFGRFTLEERSRSSPWLWGWVQFIARGDVFILEKYYCPKRSSNPGCLVHSHPLNL
jgi:hypothetical protein